MSVFFYFHFRPSSSYVSEAPSIEKICLQISLLFVWRQWSPSSPSVLLPPLSPSLFFSLSPSSLSIRDRLWDCAYLFRRDSIHLHPLNPLPPSPSLPPITLFVLISPFLSHSLALCLYRCLCLSVSVSLSLSLNSVKEMFVAICRLRRWLKWFEITTCALFAAEDV